MLEIVKFVEVWHKWNFFLVKGCEPKEGNIQAWEGEGDHKKITIS